MPNCGYLKQNALDMSKMFQTSLLYSRQFWELHEDVWIVVPLHQKVLDFCFKSCFFRVECFGDKNHKFIEKKVLVLERSSMSL